MKLLAAWDEVTCLIVRWQGVIYWLVATWHVMSCHLMWFDCLCCVMSRDAMRCHVMCAHVMSCHLLCPAMEWNGMSWRRHGVWGHVLWFEVVLCRCGDPKNYSVLQSTTPALLCTTKYSSSTTKYYSSTTLYYKVLLQHYSVLQRKPLCTTKTNSSTTRTTKILRQYYSALKSTTPALLHYYSVLQSTTPVLPCTTKYYSGTTLNHKALLYTTKYDSHTIRCTTKYYSSITLYYKVPLCKTVNYSSFTSYYKLLLRTTKNCSRTNLYYKVALMIDPWHIWTVAMQNESHDWSSPHLKRYLQCAEQQESHPPTSPNTALGTKSHSHDCSASRMKRHLQ